MKKLLSLLLAAVMVTSTITFVGTGGAVYLDESGYDGRSYMAGVMIISGDMRICDNTPGIPDLFIGEGTTVCVGTQGLTENTRMEVTLASGLLTDTIFGAWISAVLSRLQNQC